MLDKTSVSVFPESCAESIVFLGGGCVTSHMLFMECYCGLKECFSPISEQRVSALPRLGPAAAQHSHHTPTYSVCVCVGVCVCVSYVTREEESAPH